MSNKKESHTTFHIRPRYYRVYTDPGVEEAEENYRHAELDWNIPLKEAAVVSVDVWNAHFSRDTGERHEKIIKENIVPLINACRKAGLTVIHAPAQPVASRHPNFVQLVPENEHSRSRWPNSPEWPPPEFRKREGRFAAYHRPHEPQKDARDHHRETLRDFHPSLLPADGEPVISNGENLHRLCAQRGILFLFYIGFQTNACLMTRDYGIPLMASRGYTMILVRDCTTAMETHETKATLTCTKGIIATLEEFGAYTVTSRQMIEALNAKKEE